MQNQLFAGNRFSPFADIAPAEDGVISFESELDNSCSPKPNRRHRRQGQRKARPKRKAHSLNSEASVRSEVTVTVESTKIAEDLKQETQVFALTFLNWMVAYLKV